MSKLPAFQFYPADWLKALDVQICSMATQGIWINMLCYMWHQEQRGKLVGSIAKLCRLIRCTEEEFQNFLHENETHNFATVTICNGIVTVINRRMYREDTERKSSYGRVLKHRSKNKTPDKELMKQDCNAFVTPPSSSSTSVYSNNSVCNNIYPHSETPLKRTHESFCLPPDKAIWNDIGFRIGLTPDETEQAYNNFGGNDWKRANGIKFESWVQIEHALKYWRNNRGQFETKKPQQELTTKEKHELYMAKEKLRLAEI